MLSTLLQACHQIMKTLIHEWDLLEKKVGKRTADNMFVFITLAIIFEVFWFTLVLTLLLAWYLTQ